MSLKEQINNDLKTAMLAGDKTKVTTLRGLKSAILNVEVAEGSRDTGLTDDKVITLFAKEAKKRQESADLYVQGGNQERADAELEEKVVIEQYLPAQLSEAEIEILIDESIAEVGEASKQNMGQIIGLVKQKSQGSADGGIIARLVKEKIQ